MAGNAENRADDLQYNEKGYLICPKLGGGIGMLVGFVCPFLVILNKWNALFPPLLLQRTSLFEALTSRHLMSENQVANTELLLAVLLLAELAACPHFFRVNTTKYSRESPPPAPLLKAWPGQVIILLSMGIGFLCVLFLIGIGVQHGINPEFLNLKMTAFILIGLYGGAYLFIEGAISGVLFCYLFVKYWSHVI